MSIFNVTNDNNYMNSIFSSLPTTGGASTNNFLGDYYAVQNGSYYKLAKQFYAKAAAEEKSGKEADEKSLEMVKTGTEDALQSLSKLMDSNLFKKVETTDESGNKTMDYDKEEILDKLKSFVEDYNSMVEDAGEMDGDNALKAGVRLVDQMKVYKSALSQIGVSVESDNSLKIDEEAFKQADMTDVKSLFTGNVSMAKNIQSKMMQMYTSINTDLNSVDGLYSSSAVKSVSIGSMFDSLL
ncbi:MAG: hypothetical protein IJX85_11060 [Lachnospiraceae bacterium]|nr:hypothetical protein [Lachnospiraceae bacterium]